MPCASIKNTDRQKTIMQIKNVMLMKIDAEVSVLVCIPPQGESLDRRRRSHDVLKPLAPRCSTPATNPEKQERLTGREFSLL